MAPIRCSRCILPASLPSSELDAAGICRPCREYEAAYGNWEAVKDQKEREFEALLRQGQSLNREYDCLIPLSGGKDSTYALYVCSKVYGLKCLCVTFDNGFLSEPARANIRRALEATGTDHFMYTVARDHLLKLYKLFLQKSGDFCSVCMRGIYVSTQAALRASGAPLVVSGRGNRIAYLNMMPEVFQWGDSRFFENVLSAEPLAEEARPLLRAGAIPGPVRGSRAGQGFLKRKATGLVRVARRLLDRAANSLEGQSMPAPAQAEPRRVGIFDFLDVSPEDLLGTLEREMGWMRPSAEFEHMDCTLHEMPIYMHTTKFPELTAHTLYRCGLVRRGLMTREEALRAEEEELANPTVPGVLGAFLAELGLTNGEFTAAVSDWTKTAQFRRDG